VAPLDEAEREIGRLRTEVARLRGWLMTIAFQHYEHKCNDSNPCRACMASLALSGAAEPAPKQPGKQGRP
jgi:hypothetical protein